MKTKFSLLVAFLLLATSALHAANLPKGVDKHLVGTWMGFPHIMTFKKNGVAIAGLGQGYGRGTWKLQGDMLLVTMPKSGLHQFHILSFDKLNNQMTGEYHGKTYPVVRM